MMTYSKIALFLGLLTVFSTTSTATNVTWDKSRVIQLMNTYRTIHGSHGLVENNTISTMSQRWAEHIASINEPEHNTNILYGENLAVFYIRLESGSTIDVTEYALEGVQLWYNEIEYYNFNDPKFDVSTGHFTQLVWNSSTQVGLGAAANNMALYIVANFFPTGNMQNRFRENVGLPVMIRNPSPPSPKQVISPPSPKHQHPYPTPSPKQPSPRAPNPPAPLPPSPRTSTNHSQGVCVQRQKCVCLCNC